MMSEQQKNLREMLRTEGFDVREVGTPADARIVRIDRPGKPCLFVIINDMGEDGYSLWMQAPGLQMAEDVQLIKEAP